jgi:hypothetical protein
MLATEALRNAGMNYGWAFARRIRCSDEDKRQCLHLIADILVLAKKARSLGLLSLVEYIEECPAPFLRKGLQLIVDGEKPHAVREILEIAILAGGFRGKELLERCIILEGLMSVQAGLNPKSIKEMLLSFLGEEFSLVYEAEFGDSGGGDVDTFLNTLEQSQPPAPAPSNLNVLIGRLSDEEIEQCLKEISTMDLAKSLKGLSAKVQKRIFNTLPKRGAAFLREALEHMNDVTPAEMAEAHEKIEAVLKDLSVRRSPEGLAN